MPICYEIDVEFQRGDPEHIGEQQRIPLQLPFPNPLTPDELNDIVPNAYNDLVRKITGSDPSRVPYFGQFTGFTVISIYEC